jgi:hypothetical protein
MGKFSFPTHKLVALLLIRSDSAPMKNEKPRIPDLLREAPPQQRASGTWQPPTPTPFTSDVSKPIRADPQEVEIVVILEVDS